MVESPNPKAEIQVSLRSSQTFIPDWFIKTFGVQRMISESSLILLILHVLPGNAAGVARPDWITSRFLLKFPTSSRSE